MLREKITSVIVDCKDLFAGNPRKISPVKLRTLLFYLFLLFAVKGIGLIVKFIVLYCLNPLAQMLKDSWVMRFVFEGHTHLMNKITLL